MNIKQNLLYSKTHEWVEFLNDTTVRAGLTDFAQDSLGGLVFVNLPAEGDEVVAGESFGDVESVKAVSDVISPVTGTVLAINEGLLDSPEKINEDPYGAWLIEVGQVSGKEGLLSPESYEAFCEGEGH
ncbi:MAG: glycine cleavage system protein GcvH [Clostridiales bacterium]|jgi:glycine cleavage system H protein|nr:glycine cleavage system protein GcvH [Clostridiales bacterium]